MKADMNEDHTQAFRTLAMAALKLSGTMLDALAPEAQQGVETALKGGARLALEFGPLPGFQRLALVLVEAEGRRHTLGAMTVNDGPMQ
jgi:hypothetical protein